PMYKTAEEMEAAIQDYFENGITTRTVIVGKGENKQSVELPVPTITGLVLHLGFESRQSFYDYEEKPEFTYTVKRARTLIEKEYEEMMQTASTPAGAIFALKNMGWKDKQEIEQNSNVNIKGGVIIEWPDED
ncbi:DNA-packaging protein gp3, partial [uncultured Caudovirales phage]